MNNVYIYDSSQIHVYETEDFGSIVDATTSTVDHGVNMFDLIVSEGDDFIVPVGQDYIVNEVTGSIDYEDVWITETTYPVSGNINLSGGEENAATVVFIATAEPIILRERAIVVRKQAWAGSGSLFEIGSGLERMVAPYIGGSGTLRLSGDATIASTSTYTDESSITYGSDLDHGQILAAVGSSHDYGQVDGVVDEGETDNGSVVDLGGSNPFGLFSFTGHISIPNRVKSYVGSGSFSVLSGGVDQLEEPTGSQTYIVGRDLATGQFIRRDVIGLRFHGGNPEAFARVGYQGSGVLFGLSGGQEAKVYDYTSDTVVTVNTPQDYGDVLTSAANTEDYGQVSQPGYGQIDNGSVVITQTTGSAQGALNVYGAAHSARSRDYTGSGSLTAAKHIDSYREGQSSQIAFIPHYRSRGGIHVTNHVVPDAFSRPYAGSGSLFKLGEKDESVTYDYTTESIVFVTDAIDNGTVAHGTGNTEDYGSLTGVSIGVTDHGQVGITQTTPSFGLFKFSGESGTQRSRDFVGSGQFKSYKGQAVVNAGQASDFAFLPHWRSRGGITITNHVIPDAFVRTHVGSGSLFEIGQKDERATFVYNVGSVEVTVTVPEIVLAPWNGTSAYTGSNISAVASGNGSGQSGGFNSSTTTYWRFTGQSSSNTSGTNPRILTLGQLDLTNYNQFEFTTIAGTSNNGGENCDAAEDLKISYSTDNGTTYTQITVLDAEDARFTGSTFSLVTLDIPEAAKTSNVILKFHQEKHSGSAFDQWGIEYVKLLENTTVGSGSGQVYDTIDSVDQGTVDQSAGTNEDYGTVTEPFTNGIQDYGQLNPGFFKFGNLNITGGDSAHAIPRAYRGDGVLNTSGAATVLFDEPATQVYTYGLLPNQASQGEFLKIGGGMSSIISVKGTYYSSGGLFNSGVVIEKTSFDYNDSSIVTVETPIDNGQITSSGSVTDYGQVSEYGYGETNYGQVAILQTTQPFGKLFEWSGGDIAHANPVAYLGSTARIRISGGYSNLQFTSQAGESTVLFRTSGGDANKVVKVFTGTGSLFHIGDRVERRTFSYNTSSIAPTDQFTDNGLIIHTATNHSDYGQIIHDYDAELSHSLGYATGVIGDENPFGLYQFFGTADDQFFPTFAWNKKSAPIKIFNDQQDPADFRFTPHWRSRHLVGVPKISNGPGGEFNTYAQVRPFIGGGRLFGLGDKVESATFRYTTESIVVVETPEDYGHITSHPTQNLDHGAVGSVITPGGEFDNGQVVITETTQALTGLYQFSGEGVTQFFRGPYVVKPTAIRIFNEQQDPADFRFMPHWRSRPYEQGKLTGSAETPRARDFVGEGRLFGLGDKVESATFRYTTESIVVVETPEDHGLITSTPTQNLDFGSVGSDLTPDGEVDFGQVVITETTQSATGLYNFTGVGISQFFRGPYSGKGSISFYKGQSADTDFRFMPHWRGVPDEQFKVSGVAHTPRARDFVGSGSLFHIGDKIERRVYDYTTESIAVVQPGEDYGSITTTASGTLDYGSVGSVITPDGEFDNGSIVITQTTQPFGLFRFGGEGAEVKSSTPPAERFEISISGGAVEKVTAAEEDTTLFSFTGSLAEKFSKGNYAGSGSLFHIGDKIERVVFHYNTSSVGDSWGDVEDRGDITTTPTTNINNGLITDETVPPTIDYGFNIDVPGSERPFGQLFEITGGDSGHRQTFAEFSSGSLFGASGAAEVVGFNPPEETFLFGFSGAAVEKHVENYVGSGLIKYPEDTPLAPNAAVRFRPHWRSRHLLGTPRIYGNTQVAFKGAYVSKGVFSRMYTHDKGDEWLRYRPSPRYVNSIYGKIGGSAFVNGDGGTRKISVFGYYGDDRDPGTSGSLFGIGGAAESRGITPPLEDTVIFTLNGTAASKFNPHWRGQPDGSPRLYGTPELQLLFNIFTNPEGEKFNFYGDAVPVRTIKHDGSGTLFTAGSSAEVVGFNPDIETRAFKFSGEPIVRIRVILFGGGSMFGFGSGAESTTIPVPESTVLFVPSGAAVPVITLNYDGSGTEVVSGTVTEKRTASHVGDGSLFGTGGAAEAVAVSEAESTALFVPSGGDQNSFTRTKQGSGSAVINGNAVPVITLNFSGSGSLFSLGGSSEVTTVSEESTGLFEFNGTAEPVIRTRGFAGSGSLFSIGGGEEVAAVAEESTGLFTISGDAEAPFTRTKVGSGTTFVSGVKEESFSKGNYDGEGSFSTFGGAAEIVGFDPAEETFLYEFTGNATATRTRGFVGSGTATVLNETVIPVITLNYFGDGSLTTFGGAAESRTVDVENTTLFEFRNGATESFTKGNYDADGETTISGTAEPVKRTFGNQTFAYVSVSGNLEESHTRDYVGSGTFSTFSGAAESLTVTKPLDTALFSFVGENPGSVTRITQPTTAEFRVGGVSDNKVILFSPPRTYSTII